jgi:hypothetical protein
MDKPKIIYYYQTFIGLKNILHKDTKVTHIHVSSIHFGCDTNDNHYIHLNDNNPSDKIFDDLWKELITANNYGIKIILMIGGAGGAFIDLFNNFDIYYNLLCNMLDKYPIISGIDFDVEESIGLSNIEIIINRMKTDYTHFTFSMAPIQSSLMSDIDSMGGFVYKDLQNSSVGKYIDYYNTQFYFDYSKDCYDTIIDNDYSSNKIVMGMISSQNIDDNYNVIKTLINKYGNSFGGVYFWEYCQAPINWDSTIYNLFNP